MTTLGKILVFANLLFSLVTGFLILAVFSTRTNWNANYRQVEKYYQVSQAHVKAYAEEIKQIKSKDDAQIKQLTGENENLKKQAAELQKRLAKADEDLKAEISRSKEVGGSGEAAARELVQRREEVKQLQQFVAERDTKLNNLEANNKDLRDRYVRADIAARTAQQRAEQAVKQNETLAREVERLKVGGSLTQETRPPEDVKGVVLDTDPKSNLVTISIGSDAGLAKGHTLEVYRLKPEAKYLGKIRILEVSHHEAVGRPVNLVRPAFIQKGDTVESNITARP